jgi:hypothetical protein
MLLKPKEEQPANRTNVSLFAGATIVWKSWPPPWVPVQRLFSILVHEAF